MEQGIMVLKSKTDKASLKALAFQVSQITTRAVKADIELVDCIVTFGGAKDIVREVTRLDAQKRFDSILLYSPSQIFEDAVEYRAFVELMKQEFKVKVRCVRSNF